MLLFLEPSQDSVIPAILWALCGLVVAEGMALVYLIRKKQNGNGYGTAIKDLEIRVIGQSRKELDEMDTLMRGRLHEMGNRMYEQGMRQADHDARIRALEKQSE